MTEFKKLSRKQSEMVAQLIGDGEVNSNDRLGIPRTPANKRTARTLVDLGIATWARADGGQRWKIIEIRRPLTRKGKAGPVPKVKLTVQAEVEVR